MSLTFQEFQARFDALMDEARTIPLGVYKPIGWSELPPSAPVAMLAFAHPDDEWLSGMPLGLRLRSEGYRIVVVAMTLGRPEQFERRLAELSAACEYGGMELVVPGADERGLRDEIKGENGGSWEHGVNEVALLVEAYKPKVFITHHRNDGHHDHIAVSKMVTEALEAQRWNGYLVETEYWNDLDPPGCQVEVSVPDVTRVLEGVSFHVKELERNPYHTTLPLLLFLNSQYAERVTGWGKPAAPFRRSLMLRLSWVKEGQLYEYAHPKQLPVGKSVSELFR